MPNGEGRDGDGPKQIASVRTGTKSYKEGRQAGSSVCMWIFFRATDYRAGEGSFQKRNCKTPEMISELATIWDRSVWSQLDHFVRTP